MGLGLAVLGADSHYAQAVLQNTVLVIANVQVGGAGARAADIDAGGSAQMKLLTRTGVFGRLPSTGLHYSPGE